MEIYLFVVSQSWLADIEVFKSESFGETELKVSLFIAKLSLCVFLLRASKPEIRGFKYRLYMLRHFVWV